MVAVAAMVAAASQQVAVESATSWAQLWAVEEEIREVEVAAQAAVVGSVISLVQC